MIDRVQVEVGKRLYAAWQRLSQRKSLPKSWSDFIGLAAIKGEHFQICRAQVAKHLFDSQGNPDMELNEFQALLRKYEWEELGHLCDLANMREGMKNVVPHVVCCLTFSDGSRLVRFYSITVGDGGHTDWVVVPC